MRNSTERKRKANQKAYAADSGLRLALVKGESNCCFANATRAVLAQPDRLLYCEGFLIDGDYLCHHAWVKDKATGRRHEVTIKGNHPADLYICREFTRDELIGPEGRIDSPEMWLSQLNLQQQLDLLNEHGYSDLELGSYLWDSEKHDSIDFDGPHDPSKVNLLDSAAAERQLNLDHGIDMDALFDEHIDAMTASGLSIEEIFAQQPPDFPSWIYEWRVGSAEPIDNCSLESNPV